MARPKAVQIQAEAPEPELAPVAKPTARPGHTRCRVEGSAVICGGVLYEDGSEHEFSDDVVLDLSQFLIPIG